MFLIWEGGWHSDLLCNLCSQNSIAKNIINVMYTFLFSSADVTSTVLCILSTSRIHLVGCGPSLGSTHGSHILCQELTGSAEVIDAVCFSCCRN
jgi:hypothetical protein